MNACFRNRFAALLAVILGLLAASASLALPDTRDTRFLSEPTVSATQLAFTYVLVARGRLGGGE